MSSRRLVLFDIDGTLVLTGGAGLRAMNRACEHIVGHQNALDGVTLAGRTDWIILDDALTRNGLSLDPHAARSELRRRYVEHLRQEIELPGKGVKDVMPGIRALLDALERRRRVALGLLTGNFVEGARIKLRVLRSVEVLPLRRIRRRCVGPESSRAGGDRSARATAVSWTPRRLMSS